MRLGAIFPHYEIGSDPAAIRDWAQAAENLGYDHILAYDHVLGANAETYKENLTGSRAYRHHHSFHEPMVLFGHLAAVTQTIELVTGILILPQRQTALVAKQAAAVDILSGGRLRLGVGLGWNWVEYEAMGENFKTRGKRIEEQIDLMRQLWCNELVTFKGKWHIIPAAGLNPLPIQQPIPIWFGAETEPAIKRAGRLGDGWFAMNMLQAKPELLDIYQQAIADAGRDPSTVGLETLVRMADGGPDDWAKATEVHLHKGATHVSAFMFDAGFDTPQAHIDALSRFAGAVGGLK